MVKSAIGWTESTWNPVTGCTKISPAPQTLLCRAYGEAPAGDGAGDVRQRLPAHAAAPHARGQGYPTTFQPELLPFLMQTDSFCE